MIESLTYQPETSFDESKLQYNPRFDVEAFSKLKFLPPEKHDLEQENLLELTRTNLITSLAERLNVEIYKTTYRQDGQSLYHSDFYQETPFIDVIKNGQKTREAEGSTEVEREKAEIISFARVQEELNIDTTHPDTTKKVVVISPKGKGIYGHNFFDVYEKAQDGSVTMSRFTSQASYAEFKKAADDLDPFSQIPENPTDADFIANPLVTYHTLDQIKSALNQDERTMNYEEFQKVVDTIEPSIQNYLNNLKRNPNLYQSNKDHKSTQKAADIAAGLDTQFSPDEQKKILEQLQKDPLEIGLFLATQPIREVKTGCGISGIHNLNPFSVAEFAKNINSLTSGEDQYGTLEIHCDECGSTYKRTPGKLEEKCRRCGGTRGIVC